ncbi:MAG: 1-phosphofructokinase family hexose kinase [Acutalibacter sp.]|nr:1-phosphofructokinase family hexose kinase [Acutalibacter sp.]
MNMVCTVTLNPALDCYLAPARLVPGEVNRYGEPRFLPGGKGVNVSLLLHSLGEDTLAMGIAAGFTGRELENMLRQAGCRCTFFYLPQGDTRLNLKLMPPGQPETALNGEGPHIPEETMVRLEEHLAAVLREGDILVLSGSLPGCLPPDTYIRLARTVPRNVKVVLDAAGPALAAGLKAKPFLVKPNLEELGALLDLPLKKEKDILQGAKQLQRMGARNVLVSLGRRGALMVPEKGKPLLRAALPGREVSSVGAGDSMVAGFLHGWMQSGGIDTALDWGLAAGAATAFQQGIAKGEEVEKLYKEHFSSRARK